MEIVAVAAICLGMANSVVLYLIVSELRDRDEKSKCQPITMKSNNPLRQVPMRDLPELTAIQEPDSESYRSRLSPAAAAKLYEETFIGGSR